MPRGGHKVFRKKESSPRRRWCSPRRRASRHGYVRLSEPDDGFGGCSGSPRRGCYLPRLACDCVESCVHGLFKVDLVAQFIFVCGLLRGH